MGSHARYIWPGCGVAGIAELDTARFRGNREHQTHVPDMKWYRASEEAIWLPCWRRGTWRLGDKPWTCLGPRQFDHRERDEDVEFCTRANIQSDVVDRLTTQAMLPVVEINIDVCDGAQG